MSKEEFESIVFRKIVCVFMQRLGIDESEFTCEDIMTSPNMKYIFKKDLTVKINIIKEKQT